MRCACPNCGDLMPQATDASKCVCPYCGHSCDACLGGTSQPLSLEKIKELALHMDFGAEDPKNTPEG